MIESKLVVVIPARGASKRLKNKNLRSLGGYSLLTHSILYALSSLKDIPVFVSTEDENIKKEAQKYGAQVIDRPIELAMDETTTVEVIQHAIDSIAFDVEDVILLQPTNPLRPQGILYSALKAYKSRGSNSLFTVSPQLKKLGEINDHRFVPRNYQPGQRSQDMNPWYYENGLLYIASRDIIKSGQLITREAHPYIVDHIFGTVDIDTATDLDYAEFIFSHYRKEIFYLPDSRKSF
ncbi:acylneuraminate cytidylyltransferase family protein [Winogradskyella aurantiaca]|uniref:acylneuraminate cytidylyltransferase family protein n=1 Tax=Winogradskyella aurantiaca TaxID=2219558 RepID=UPI001E3D84A7|nr:acylneuraminate cytidylyltransferase family protein [Winogradskyella aurantiaca]